MRSVHDERSWDLQTTKSNDELQLTGAACVPGADDCCSNKAGTIATLARSASQRHVLVAVLVINAAMFAIEMAAGVITGSAALLADSVDMFGDAAVYGLSLYALTRGARWHAGAALAKSGIIMVFGVWILGGAIFGLHGDTPSAGVMAIVGMAALAANLICFVLLWQFRNQDVNMSSTFECSRNDLLANGGVLLAAGSVWVTGAAWPDLLIACLIAAVFLRSAWGIGRAAWPQLRHPEQRTEGVGA